MHKSAWLIPVVAAFIAGGTWMWFALRADDVRQAPAVPATNALVVPEAPEGSVQLPPSDARQQPAAEASAPEPTVGETPNEESLESNEAAEKRAELELLYERLDGFREHYGALSLGEYRQAFTDAQNAHSQEVALLMDERQARGDFDAVLTVEYGTPVEPPEGSEGKTSTRVLSEPTADGKNKTSFIVVRHDDHPALVALEKEMIWLQQQIDAMEGR